MPDLKGRLGRQEAVFAKIFAETGSKALAAKEAGYAQPHTAASKALARPRVQAEVARVQNEILFSEILPLAVKVHKQILEDERTPAGARVQAVKLAYDRTLGTDAEGRQKEPHEMTREELAEAIAKLEQEAASKARDVTPEPSSIDDESGVFD